MKGDTAEQMAEWRAKIYRTNHDAEIFKVRTSGRIVRTKDGETAMIPELSPPDFFGTIRGGRCIIFDTKECQGDRYRHSAKQLHQLEDLRRFHELGAAAFLLVLRGDGLWFILWPAETWQEPCRGYKAVLSEDGTPVPCENGYGLPDFLAIVSTESESE